jgi:dynein intermediate chain 3, axonemal
MADEEEQPALPPPEGCKPMMIGMKNMDERYGLKTGPGMRDVLPFKLFNKEEVLDEIKKLGFYSDFNDFKSDIKAYKGEELLIVADLDELYGQNWYICLTEAAKEKVFKEVNDKVNAEKAKEEARLKAIADEKAAKLAEEERIKNAVYEDKPFLSKVYQSNTLVSTRREIFQEQVNISRPLIKISIKRKRRDFNAPTNKFGELGPQGAPMEFNKHKDPNFELERKVMDVGLQDCPSWTATWLPIDRAARKAMKVSREEPTLSEEEVKDAVALQEMMEGKTALRTNTKVSAATQTTFFSVRNNTTQSVAAETDEGAINDIIEGGKLSSFLRKCGAMMERDLQTNETVDIFANPFTQLANDEVSFGNKDEVVITELRNFQDLTYSKGKNIDCVDWHPKDKRTVAVSCNDNITFDERVERSGKSSNAYVLIWSFADMISPHLILQSPHEINVFKFCQNNPNLIAGGCISGQVVLWDVSEAKDALRKAARKRASNDGNDDDDNSKTVPPVRPKFISSIEDSHKRPVGDLAWLQNSMEISTRGNIDVNEKGETNQFITVAGDGNFFVWDLRFKELTKKRHADKKSKGDEETPWTPHFKLPLTKMGGVGELLLRKICLLGEESQSRFLCATEEGELVDADWREANAGLVTKKGDGGEDGVSGESKNVNMICPDHFRPCVSLQQSPFFKDIFLSVGDWSFNIWKQGVSSPIFSSPFSTSYFTGGLWSPSRPGVIVLCKVDGSVDIWDLVDQSHAPSMTAPVASSKITSMSFRDGAILACGDSGGNLHILDVPRTYRKKIVNEDTAMTNFFDRENRRVQYVAGRLAERGEGEEEEEDQDDAEMEMDEKAVAEAKKAAKKKEEEALRKEEEEYRKLEAYYREELGVQEGNGIGAEGVDLEVKKEGDGY